MEIRMKTDDSSRIIIRCENCGVIIWSTRFKKYYSLNDILSGVLLGEIEKKEDILPLKSIGDPMLMSVLSHLGDGEDLVVIDNRGKTERLLYSPLEYYFDFTSKCNLRCSECYNLKHLGTVSMEESDIRAIIKEMASLGIMRLHLAGGEPTIEPNLLFAYLDEANNNNITTSMATNGTMITKTMAKEILSRDLFAISVSLDGWDEKSNKARRSDGRFDDVKAGIHNLVEAKEELGVGTEICIKPTYSSGQQQDFFEKMINFAISNRADKIKFANPERSLNHEKGYYGIDISGYYDNISCLRELVKKYGNKILITQITNPFSECNSIGIRGLKGCIGAQELIAINPDGRITPCLMNDTLLGNYHDWGSMKEFYDNSYELNDYLMCIDNPACYSCSVYSKCRGGCQVRKIVEHGTIMGKDPLCPASNIDMPMTSENDEEKLFSPINVFHSL